MMTEPTVSVLIVNWNTEDLLRQCLDSLQTAEAPGFLEIIVVDNGSQDGSAQSVRDRADPTITLIENTENVGFGAAVNQADERATAPYRLMLNSDTVVPPGTISGCLDVLDTTDGVAGVGCQLLNADGSHQNSVFRFPSLRGIALTASFLSKVAPDDPRLNWDRYGKGDWTTMATADVVMGAFLLLKRDVVELDQPLLDEGFFMYGEETDLCRRIQAKGQRIVFVPQYSVMHVHGASSRSPEQLAWAEASKRKATLRFIRKWHRAPVPSIANFLLLVGLAPRWASWAFGDLRDLLQRRPPSNRRYRAGAARFHLRAMLRTSVMDEPWGPPPQ